jgi:hypothetical protein
MEVRVGVGDEEGEMELIPFLFGEAVKQRSHSSFDILYFFPLDRSNANGQFGISAHRPRILLRICRYRVHIIYGLLCPERRVRWLKGADWIEE